MIQGENNFRILEITKFRDSRGELSVVQNDQIPFEIQRTFFITDIPNGMSRGGHANRNCHELIICLQGGVSAQIDNGEQKYEVSLSLSNKALYLPPLHWVTLKDIRPNTIILVLASHKYDPFDKIFSYENFKKQKSLPEMSL
jgi:dTDP-4-dehydrorhamnose 3,5-epimerase-like enzyme